MCHCQCSDNCSDKSWEEDLICPITLDLPFEPVMAMDGRIYDRSAIETHFATQGCDVKSPMTGKLIGTWLLPAPQHKNLVETAIRKGVVSAELVETWRQREEEKKNNEDLLQRAEKGDVLSMESVCYNYMYGKCGFPYDMKMAYMWAQKAHHLGSTMATATLGWLLINGNGVDLNPQHGIRYLSLAAHKGSSWAACRLGMALADGLYGLAVDHDVAIHWLQISLTKSANDDLTGHGRINAESKLAEILRLQCV